MKLKDIITSQNHQIAKLQNLTNQQKAQIENLENQLTTCRARDDKFTKKIQEQENENNRIQRELDRTNEMLKSERELNRILMEQNDDLQRLASAVAK